jgi:hypothetical protein
MVKLQNGLSDSFVTMKGLKQGDAPAFMQFNIALEWAT